MLIKKIKKEKSFLNLNPTQMVVAGFAGVILLGAFLLTLPISSRSGDWTNPVTALFTATSATCVTGLVVVDTYTYWNTFGQIVILLLIQVGGLGFMTMATLLSLLIGRTITFKERLIMVQSLNLNETSGIVRLTKHMLVGTLMFEGAGAVILSIRFAADYGFAGGIYRGIFHAVSAFCNAGFDVMGDQGQFVNLTPYVNDTVVNIVVMSLIVIGGLGFFVWEDIYGTRSFKRLSLYSKLVLIVTAFLIVSGAVLIFAFEFSNPATLGALDAKGKVLASFFQSVTPRTAGFNTINLTGTTEMTKILTVILMFIGGSSGSTAGGIKTITFAVIIITVFQVAMGKTETVIMGRRIGRDNVLRAFTVAIIALAMIFVGVFIILWTDGFRFLDTLFETVSAFGTVGLSLSVTPHTSVISRLVLILLMFFGRVGILTISLSIAMASHAVNAKIEHPETKVMIG